MCKGVYSPRIAEDLIPALFRMARVQDRPMTKIVDEVLREELFIRGIIDNEDAGRNSGKRYVSRK